MTTVHSTRTLAARAYRDGKWWTIEIPELTSDSPRGGDSRIMAVGQARSVKEIQATAVDLAAVWLDVDESDVDITVAIEIPRQRPSSSLKQRRAKRPHARPSGKPPASGGRRCALSRPTESAKRTPRESSTSRRNASASSSTNPK